MSDPKTLTDLLAQLQQTIGEIQEHHEWNEIDGPSKVFDAVSGPILPLLHNYKWREKILTEKANQVLGKSPGVHGSDGKTRPEMESKSAKLKSRLINIAAAIGMYDKIESKVDSNEALDTSPLLDHFNTGAVREEAALALIQATPLQGKEGKTVMFSSPRRAARLLKILEEKSVLARDKMGDLVLGVNPWVAVEWPPTLLTIGVARYEHSVFGLFGAQEKALLTVLCDSKDIEEVLGDHFEKRFGEYREQMDVRGSNPNHGAAPSAHDSVKISLEQVLSLPSSRVIHLDTGALWSEKIKLDPLLVDKIQKMPDRRTQKGVIKQQISRYVTQFEAHEQSLKNAKIKP